MAIVNRCAYLDKDHKFSLLEKPVPKPANDEVIVKIAANGICGSDVHFFVDGKLGNFRVTDPYIPGHESCGTIHSTGCSVTDFKAGDRVIVEPGIPCGRCAYCKEGRYNLCRKVVFLSAPPTNGTFCDYIAIRSDSVYRMPDNMSFEQGAMAEPAAVALHAVNRACFRHGDTGAIVGAGPIGLMVLQAFKAAGGGRAICLDRFDNRLSIAKELGADEVVNIDTASDELSDIADVVFETAGSTAATSNLFRLARVGGRVVQVGWPGSNIVPMNIADFLDKELVYTGVNRYANAFPAAITWISDGRIDTAKLITNRFPLDRVEEAFKYNVEHMKDVIKVLVVN